MTHTIELQSERYLNDSRQKQQRVERKQGRRRSFERFVFFAGYVACAAILAVLFSRGYFDNVDVVGAYDKFRIFLMRM